MLRFKSRVREITSRVRRIPGRVLLAELDCYLRGWANYYAKFKGSRYQLGDSDRWIRRRIRQWLWVQWKTTQKRRENLRKGDVPQKHAILASHIRSAWKASINGAMNTCVTNDRIKWGGLIPLVEHWQRLATL